jgi:hypothetical protein
MLHLVLFVALCATMGSLTMAYNPFPIGLKKNFAPALHKGLLGFGAAALLAFPPAGAPSSLLQPTLAAEPQQRIFKSGKNPNQAPDSKVGTRKDTKFLRCMSDCKSKCQLPGAGLAKTDCVQDCQDQCCESYEQCSFKIKINSGNSI